MFKVVRDYLGRLKEVNIAEELQKMKDQQNASYVKAEREITREIILNDLWDGTGNFVDDNTLSVYIRRLREKVEIDASHPQHLITVRGFGYQWKEVDI